MTFNKYLFQKTFKAIEWIKSLFRAFVEAINRLKKNHIIIVLGIIAAIFTAGLTTRESFDKLVNSEKHVSGISIANNFNDNMPSVVGFLYSSIKDSGCSIMLSNPPVYKFLNKGDKKEFERISGKQLDKLSFKDYNIVNIGYEKVINKIDTFRYLMLSPNQYTGLGEAIGLQLISCFFKSNNIRFNVTQSINDYPRINTILLGGWISHKKSEQTVSKIERLHREWNIRYCTFDGSIVLDKKDTVYTQSFNGNELVRDYAIITKAPHPYDYSKIIIICSGINSQGTQMAAKIISNIDDLRKLKNLIENQIGTIPNWFQVIIEVTIKDEQPIDNWVLKTVEPITKK